MYSVAVVFCIVSYRFCDDYRSMTKCTAYFCRVFVRHRFATTVAIFAWNKEIEKVLRNLSISLINRYLQYLTKKTATYSSLFLFHSFFLPFSFFFYTESNATSVFNLVAGVRVWYVFFSFDFYIFNI